MLIYVPHVVCVYACLEDAIYSTRLVGEREREREQCEGGRGSVIPLANVYTDLQEEGAMNANRSH